MNQKTVLISLCAVIIIGGALYIGKPSPKMAEVTPEPVITQNEPIKTPEATSTIKELPKTASSNQIIDYIVDDLTTSESNSVKSSIDSPAPSQADVVIQTNF